MLNAAAQSPCTWSWFPLHLVLVELRNTMTLLQPLAGTALESSGMPYTVQAAIHFKSCYSKLGRVGEPVCALLWCCVDWPAVLGWIGWCMWLA